LVSELTKKKPSSKRKKAAKIHGATLRLRSTCR